MMSSALGKKFLVESLVATIAIGSIITTVNPAQAYRIFTGEDIGLGATDRLLSTPNSDAARDDFLNNLITNNIIPESFEDLPLGPSSSFVVEFNDISTDDFIVGDLSPADPNTGQIAEVTDPTGTDGFGRYPITGENFYRGLSEFTIDDFEYFDGSSSRNEVAALGFYTTDIGDFDSNLVVTLRNEANEVIEIFELSNNTGSNTVESGGARFFGIIAEEGEGDQLFTSVTITDEIGSFDVFGLDNLIVATPTQVNLQPGPTPVPEPASMLGLLAMGVFGVHSMNKRKSTHP